MHPRIIFIVTVSLKISTEKRKPKTDSSDRINAVWLSLAYFWAAFCRQMARAVLIKTRYVTP